MSNHILNLLLIGVGPHARRFYLPAIARLGPGYGIRLVGAVELPRGRDTTRQALADCSLNAEVITVPPFEHAMRHL